MEEIITGLVTEETPEIPVEEVVVEVEEEQCAVEEVESRQIGIISNCNRLNIRALPIKDSTVLSIVPVGTELEVLGVSDGWYNVCTASGIEGYCMTQYVIVQ